MIAKPVNGTAKKQGMLIIRDASYNKRRGIPAALIHSFNEEADGNCSIELIGQGRYGRTSYTVKIPFEELVEHIGNVLSGHHVDISSPAAEKQAPAARARHISLYPSL